MPLLRGKVLSIAAEKYSGINIGRCGKNMRRRICAGLWIMIVNALAEFLLPNVRM